MKEILTTLERAAVVNAAAANSEQYMLFLAALSNSELHETEHACWMSNPRAGGNFNRIISLRMPAVSAEEELAALVRYYKQRRKAFSCLVTPLSQPANLGELLQSYGLKQEEMPCMAVDLQAIHEDAPLPNGFVIKLCDTSTLMYTWLQVFARNFPVLDQKIIFEGYAKQDRMQQFQLQFHLGLLHGVPVAISLSLLAAGVAGIYSIETVPQARRQGIGALMTLASLVSARDSGYRVAILGSSPMGYHLYQRLGFQEYERFHFYYWDI
jgi:GNAT superfamily N-acetyltransferase